MMGRQFMLSAVLKGVVCCKTEGDDVHKARDVDAESKCRASLRVFHQSE